MKEVLTLAARKREKVGSRESRRLRASGLVPCVVYGHKQDPLAITVGHDELGSALRHHTRMVDLDIQGATERVLLSEVQHDPYGLEIIHADFVRVAMDELIRVRVPVILRGTAKGEQRGGVVEQLLVEVEVECLPGDIPESIALVVSDLEVGQSVHVADLKAPDNVRIVTDPAHLVLTVAAPKKVEEVVAAPAEAAAVEPEVIGRGKAEEEEGEEAAKA